MDAGNMLKPALARGELHCIGATNRQRVRKHIEKTRPGAALPAGPGREPSVEDTSRSCAG